MGCSGRVWFCSGNFYSTVMWPGARLNIKIPSYQYRDPHVKEKTVSRPSYLQHGNPHTWERRSLYWDGALNVILSLITDNSFKFLMACWATNNNKNIKVHITSPLWVEFTGSHQLIYISEWDWWTLLVLCHPGVSVLNILICIEDILMVGSMNYSISKNLCSRLIL